MVKRLLTIRGSHGTELDNIDLYGDSSVSTEEQYKEEKVEELKEKKYKIIL